MCKFLCVIIPINFYFQISIYQISFQPPLPHYPPSSNALLFDDDPGVMSEVETASTGFRRGGKQRSSLPVVRTPSKTLEQPLGKYFYFIYSHFLTHFKTYIILLQNQARPSAADVNLIYNSSVVSMRSAPNNSTTFQKRRLSIFISSDNK